MRSAASTTKISSGMISGAIFAMNFYMGSTLHIVFKMNDFKMGSYELKLNTHHLLSLNLRQKHMLKSSS